MSLMLSTCDSVSREQLRMIPARPKSDTHEPIKHIDFLESIEKAIGRSGYIETVGEPELGVSKDGEHFLDSWTSSQKQPKQLMGLYLMEMSNSRSLQEMQMI